MASARDKVLNIPELLERVLVNLDERTLLLSQRVCRKWNSTIIVSPSLQAALFFRVPQIINHTDIGDRIIKFNPLLTNPAITVRNCGFRVIALHGKPDSAPEVQREHDTVNYHLEIVGSKIWPPGEASWKRMFLADVHLEGSYGDPGLSLGHWNTQREPFKSMKMEESSMRIVFEELKKAKTVYTAEDLDDDDGWMGTPDPRQFLRDWYRAASDTIAWRDANPEEYSKQQQEAYEKECARTRKRDSARHNVQQLAHPSIGTTADPFV